ncbi:carbamoyltransferase HypF [Frateuria defendens]|uniref:carbamoyltransferase HypF n=1 Tax=Frateuria defendens TaxID=2219559 RepID=UPI00066FF371|nr:carbamoyltransferase HypF [Frateuria defendens]
MAGLRLELRGIVQGVGFRPSALRLARELGVAGEVRNAGSAVVVEAYADAARLEAFAAALAALRRGGAQVDRVRREVIPVPAPPPADFRIAASTDEAPGLGVARDLAACPACVAETMDPFSRRYRYPFTACTDCGPRLSVITGTPYDRANTTLAGFPLCADCAAEYGEVADRRFHAEANACYRCGPRATLRRMDGRPFALDALTFLDDVDAAASLIRRGEIVLVKGLGGYQLACDAASEAAVARLRAVKRRDGKPFALMARDLAMLREYCEVEPVAEAELASAAAPIVLLPRRAGAPALAAGIAPGLSTLGVMLPSTPLHHLLFKRLRAPMVLTSGNLSGQPQATGPAQLAALEGVDWVLDHDRPIARRVDDSVVRIVAGRPRLLRRARGYAPAPLPVPPGFDAAPRVLALGGDLKNSFALVHEGQAILSQHIGDLHDAACLADWEAALADYRAFFRFQPDLVACDRHPGYLSHAHALAHYPEQAVPVGHHHAHLVACLGEHGWPLEGGAVLGVVFDGLGYGDDGGLWGGEFLLGDYRRCRRLASLRPMPLPGGDRAASEPWRNLYAHLVRCLGWERFERDFAGLGLRRRLAALPHGLLQPMLATGLQAPPSSSAGRWFDAVAAALELCFERIGYEGEAAIRLESCAAGAWPVEAGYPFAETVADGLPRLDPAPMWPALLADLAAGCAPARVAARFHAGLADAVAALAGRLAAAHGCGTVALSGGVFQNRLLAERVVQRLAACGLAPLLPSMLPAGDGGLALGQALIALARYCR